MRSILLSLARGFGLLSCAIGATATSASSSGSVAPTSDVTTDALATLNDIGGMADFAAPFSISPDGRQVAVVVRTGDPQKNIYRGEIVVVDIGNAMVVHRQPLTGGAILQMNAEGRPIGTLETIVPQWSPDGARLYLRAERDGAPQIIEVSIATGEERQVSNIAGGVIAFKLRPDGRRAFVKYNDEPPTISPATALAEHQSGYRYDDRWRPSEANRPIPLRPVEKRADVALQDGKLSSLPDTDNFDAEYHPNLAIGEFGRAKIEALKPEFINSPVGVSLTDGRGNMKICPQISCGGAEAIWWGSVPETLFVKRRTGWANSVTEIVAWKPGEERGKVLISTDDMISACQSGLTEFVCAIEGSARPRRIVAFDQVSGRQRVLFDPNTKWDELRVGSVRRLHWRNHLGLEVIGDLVLPPQQHGREKLPLVIVGYTTRGFLRGGTGDVVPIFPLAAQGFAVLSVQNPTDTGMIGPVRSLDESIRKHFNNWSDRRSASDAIQRGLDIAIGTGLIDPGRIGITGFSNGAENARFTMIEHPTLFRAAALYTCCDDPVAARIAFGPQTARKVVTWGYPRLAARDRKARENYSIAANAGRIKTPILVQVSDREYLLALEAFAAFSEAGKCIEMYVFPDEYHITWQPAHRLAIYNRTISWFKRWLDVTPEGLSPPTSGQKCSV